MMKRLSPMHIYVIAIPHRNQILSGTCGINKFVSMIPMIDAENVFG